MIYILHGLQKQAPPGIAEQFSAYLFGHPAPSKTFSPKGSKLFSSGLPQADTLHSWRQRHDYFFLLHPIVKQSLTFQKLWGFPVRFVECESR